MFHAFLDMEYIVLYIELEVVWSLDDILLEEQCWLDCEGWLLLGLEGVF
jgi:hypothetical protein